MLILLALSGCNIDELRLEAAEDADVEVVEAAPAEGELRIATSPDRDERRRAPVLEAPLPAGEPKVDMSCFGLMDEGMVGIGGGLGARGSGLGGGGVATGAGGAPPPPPSAVTASPAPRPAPPPKKAPKPLDLAKSAPEGRPAASADASEPASQPTPDRAGDLQAASKLLRLLLDDDSDKVAAEEAPAEPVFAQDKAKRQEQKQQPVLDWGAVVHLSNDDSMSLASAQRVLYGMSRGMRLSPSEIRPHELLNYFSFDTAGAPDGTAFRVLGAAEQDGETLTMSLAVHGANPPRQPLDMTVLLDRSCSMQAEGRMDYTKRGLNLLSDQLQRGDRVDLVLFDSGVCTPLEGFVVGRDDPALLRSVISKLAPTGATNLDAGLQEAYRIQTSREPAEVHKRNRRVLLLTDAQLNTGNVNQAVVSQVGAAFDDHDIRLTGIGVGRDFNDEMLDELTEKGKGAYVYLGSEAVVDRVFGPGFDSLTRTVAHDVRFSLDLPDSLAMERFYGEEASTNPEDVQPIHYYADTTQLFLQDLRIRDGRLVRTDPVVMRIEYRDAATGEPEVQELRTTVGALLDGDPHNLRKGKALMAFSDLVMAQALRADPCAGPLDTYRERASLLSDDAEIAYVNGLVGKTCRVDMSAVVARGVPFKVKVDADIPIPEVTLECAGRTHLEKLSGADTVARFGAVAPGACTVRLQGNLPMAAAVEVPETGGDIRCLIRGGRLSCG